jgi:uncharacterized cupredoxin-like copper-binding protein
MKRLTIFGMLALAALLAAFGFSSRAAAQTPQQVNLTLSEFMISPMSFTAQAGQVVHFNVTNAGKFPHSVSFVYEGKFSTLFKTPIPAGQTGSADFVFPEAGAWQMYCPVGQHAENGMTGQVTILTAAGAPGMPSTGAPGGTGFALPAGLALALMGVGLFVRRRLQAAGR